MHYKIQHCGAKSTIGHNPKHLCRHTPRALQARVHAAVCTVQHSSSASTLSMQLRDAHSADQVSQHAGQTMDTAPVIWPNKYGSQRCNRQGSSLYTQNTTSSCLLHTAHCQYIHAHTMHTSQHPYAPHAQCPPHQQPPSNTHPLTHPPTPQP
jgi:hypothetical protein